jgi:OOP family OmpA-OmpF porin
MKKSIVWLSAALLLATAAPGFAEIKPNTFNLSAFVGGYVFDGVQQLDGAVNLGGRLGYDITKNVGVEISGNWVPTQVSDHSPIVPGKDVNYSTIRLDALYYLMPDKKFVPFVDIGIGEANVYSNKALEKHRKPLVEYGIGAKYFLNDKFALRGDVKHIMTVDHQWRNNLEYTVGLSYAFGFKKSAAAPVVTPEVKPAEPAAPAAARPTCQLTAKPASIKKGETSALNWTSANTTDCDLQPAIGPVATQGTKNVTPAADTTYTLSCNGAGGKATSSAMVAVVAPASEEKVSPAAPAAPQRERATITLKVEFPFNKYNVLPKYDSEIEKVAEFLKKYPTAKGVIEGHTDSIGSKNYNVKLSEKRAESVKNILVTKYGIDGTRLTTKGWWFSKPVATNKTAEGRQRNRRIEGQFDTVTIVVE